MKESIPCPLCNAEPDKQKIHSDKVYLGKPGQKIMRCAVCDVAYLYPMLSETEKEKFYKDEFHEFMEKRAGTAAAANSDWLVPENHIKANERQVARRMKYIKPHLPVPGGRILDIGCSSGFMLFPLKELGYDCIGIEPAANYSQFISSKGILCFQSLKDFLDSTEAETGFDLITHFFVADEMLDPILFIRQQIPLLREGGKIIFEVNSTDDALLSLYKLEAFNEFFWQVSENYFFSVDSFTYMIKKFGLPYKIILDQRYDLSNHLTWAIEGKPGGMGRFKSYFGSELEEYYRKALIKSKHCDTLIGILENT